MSKPAVDGLERDLSGRARLLRVNILDPVGRAVADAHQVEVVPTFLVFSAQGEPAARVIGRVPGAAEVRAALDGGGPP